MSALVDPVELAAKMKRFGIWSDQSAPATVERHHYDGAPFGSAYVVINPAEQPEAASFNDNRIVLCGRDGLSREGLEDLFALFKARGVERFFAWLSPGPGIEDVRAWLSALGFSKNPWMRYPALLLQAPSQETRTTDLLIREATPQMIAEHEAKLGALPLGKAYLRNAGRPGHRQWIAFDGAEPVAIATLACFEDVGYLGGAGTKESHRGRGAQSALVAARIAKAQALGLKLIVSDTLTILKDSLGNLKRAGLREIYEKEVYGRYS